LQSVGVSGGTHLFNAMPYALTLLILVWSCSPQRAIQGAPQELGVSR
jgi:simple sugar transport system permease protein